MIQYQKRLVCECVVDCLAEMLPSTSLHVCLDPSKNLDSIIAQITTCIFTGFLVATHYNKSGIINNMQTYNVINGCLYIKGPIFHYP